MMLKGKVVKVREIFNKNGEQVVSKFSGKPMTEILVQTGDKLESLLVSDGIAKRLETLDGITGSTTIERLNALKASGRETTFTKITEGKFSRWEVL